jgi:hypothetical protein
MTSDPTTDRAIIDRVKALGVDAKRLKDALDSRDNWGALVHSFEYLTALGVLCDAMQHDAAAQNGMFDGVHNL